MNVETEHTLPSESLNRDGDNGRSSRDLIHNDDTVLVDNRFGSRKKHHLTNSSVLLAGSYSRENIDSLTKTVQQLQEVLANHQEKLEASELGNPFWYETIPDLSHLEREVMTEFFKEGLDIDKIAGNHEIVTHRVFLLIQSGCRKYTLLQENLNMKKIVTSLIKS